MEPILRTTSGHFVAPTNSGQFTSVPTPAAGAFRAQVLDEKTLARVFERITDPRNRAILALMVGAGLRMAEVAELEVASLLARAGGAGMVFLPATASTRARLVPLAAGLFRILTDYAESTGRQPGDPGPLFLRREASDGDEDGGLTHHHVAMVMMRSLHLAEVDVEPLVDKRQQDGMLVLPEVLRHTFVSRFLCKGGGLVALQQILGHTSLETTRAYVFRLLGPVACSV